MKKIGYNTKLPKDDELTPTSSYKYIKYPFEKFNRVQSLLVNKKHYEKDMNLVLATNTSTGKTVCAELYMGQVLYRLKKKVIYVSPLKSLTQEKYDDWINKFHDKKVCIVTGDYSDDSKIAKKFQESDIICVTSEMLDSKTRSVTNLLKWGKSVGLIVIDEFHILDMEGRGHAVESGLMRFCQYCPHVRLLCLSATVPNVDDFRKWFDNMNGKRTLVIKSDWRPVKLGFHYVELFNATDYKMSMTEKINVTHELVEEKQDQKFLCFVHDKNTGRQLTKTLNQRGVDCGFHCADLTLKQRQKLEKDFADRNNGNRVLVSTSTLAWGRSLPARNVIIVGSTRGKQTVDEFDILQMAGRSGRLGIDDEGDCYFLTHNVPFWEALLSSLKDVNSTLIEKDYLEFQITAEVAIGNIYNFDSLNEWHKKSLAYIQDKGNHLTFNECLYDLDDTKMIEVVMDSISIKPLGKVSAHLYFLPKDVHTLKKKLYALSQNVYNNYTLAYLFGANQSWSLPYVPKDQIKDSNQFAKDFTSKTGIYLKSCATTYNLYKYFASGERNVYNYQAVNDVKRIDSALSWISSIQGISYESLYE